MHVSSRRQATNYLHRIKAAFPEAKVGTNANEVFIEPDDPPYSTFLKIERNEISPDRIDLAIRTRYRDGSRPMLFEQFNAADIAREAIRYLDSHSPLLGLNFEWRRPSNSETPSTNYHRYLETRRHLHDTLPYEEIKIAAAFSVWTIRKIAVPTGFGQLTQVRENGNKDSPISVEGTIWRPKTNSLGRQSLFASRLVPAQSRQ